MPEEAQDFGVVGLFYDMTKVMSILDLSWEEVLEKVATHDILCCVGAEETLLFPAFQFTERGEMVPAISEVIKILASGANAPWRWAKWLGVALEEWGGISAAQWLKEGRNIYPVMGAAQSDAIAWSSQDPL